ncbi:MAG: ATP-binding protein [bacterium]|nr:ATP-binding protein [bacterium]
MASLEAGEPAESHHRVVAVDGTARWVRAINQPVHDPAGPTNRSVITVEDITERMHAEQALQQAEAAARTANDAKNHFLSRMSHELRTPLNAILGFGQLLQYELDDTKHAESLKQIVKGGRHLLNLINDILDVARIEAGEMSISLEAVPIHGLLTESMQLMEPLAESSDVLLLTTAHDEDLTVLADRQRLRQVLLNLLSNAIKYNRPGGKVWVEQKAVDGHVAVSVCDDGPGISADLQARLFTPFDRLDVESSGIDGTGIGLSLTRSLTELMGGSVTVHSEAGHGATFTVTLPTATRTTILDGPDARAVSRADARSVGEGTFTLLYVEDNEPNVRVVESILTLRPEWRMIHAGQGGLGIELARAHRPDLVLLDLHLPDRSGADVLAALKGTPDTRSIPVVIVTADATSGAPSRLVESGAEAALTKPFELADLLAILDAHVRTPAGPS